jgi:hypothetical protein
MKWPELMMVLQGRLPEERAGAEGEPHGAVALVMSGGVLGRWGSTR